MRATGSRFGGQVGGLTISPRRGESGLQPPFFAMTERELQRILKSLDDAIEVFQSQKGPLSAREISVKSMLLALRMQVNDQIQREKSGLRE